MAQKALSRAELLDLPPVIDIRTAARQISIGEAKAYRMAKDGTFPVPVLRLGAWWRVVTEDLLKLLGIEREAA
jgi:predicted site-specific integrase-resolvase